MEKVKILCGAGLALLSMVVDVFPQPIKWLLFFLGLGLIEWAFISWLIERKASRMAYFIISFLLFLGFLTTLMLGIKQVDAKSRGTPGMTSEKDIPLKKEATYSMGDVKDNKGIVTQGQVGDNIIHQRMPFLVLGAEALNNVTTKIPSKENKIIVRVLEGEHQAIREKVANQLIHYLISEGYEKTEKNPNSFVLIGGPNLDFEIGPLESDKDTIAINVLLRPWLKKNNG